MRFSEYPVITAVNVQDNYSLLVTFDNGEIRLFDMINDIQNDNFFAALKNKELFSQCRVFGKGYAVQWNEDIDLASEYIYDNSVDYKE